MVGSGSWWKGLKAGYRSVSGSVFFGRIRVFNWAMPGIELDSLLKSFPKNVEKLKFDLNLVFYGRVGIKSFLTNPDFSRDGI